MLNQPLNQMWQIGIDTDTKLGPPKLGPYDPCQPQIFCELKHPAQCYMTHPCDPSVRLVPIEPSPPIDLPDDGIIY